MLKPENNSSEIKIDQIRYLTEFFNKTSHSEGFKISIINDADRLNINSTNALLKTLEEPSGASILFLCSSLPGQLSPTLRSRCQEFSMNQPNRNETLDKSIKNLEFILSEYKRLIEDFIDKSSS